MDYHHVIEAAGAVALALVFYSYAWRWFDAAESPRRARWRPVVNGVAFGMLAVFLMMSRIQVGEGHWVDARAVPLALITLVEGTPAGAIAGGIALARRLWLGGAGALPGGLAIVAGGAGAAAAPPWGPPAGRGGGGRGRRAVARGPAARARRRARDQQSPHRRAGRPGPRRAPRGAGQRGRQVDRARARGGRAHPRHRRADEPHHAGGGGAADRGAAPDSLPQQVERVSTSRGAL